ncbi:MAG TPA: FG-GAP-like repeat-containing protein [Vicinamibacteria bacterium]|nr:FG-GAP-like repeat-containing protein [Vicinamibacteria bacterium]
MKQRRGVLLGFLALGLAVSAAVPVLRAQSKGTPPNQPGPSRAGAGQAVSPAREGAWRENNVGVAELEQFRFADAAEAFKRALARDASLTAAKINLAIAYLYVPDIPAAKAAAQAALLAVPDAPQPNYLLALVARTEGRAEEAIPYLEKVLAKDPRDLGANVTLGQCYLQMREYEKAAATFRIAADAEPYNVSAAYNLGVALTRSGKREEGQAAMQRFQKLRDSGYKTALGSNYMEQGRYAEALGSTGAEAEAVDPQTPAVKLVEGEVPAGASPQAAAPTLWTAKALPAGLQQALPRAALVLADVDGDGAPDVIEAGLPSLRVLRNEKGRYQDVTEKLGLAGVPALALVAGDYDNDGRVDLLVLKPGGLALFHHEAEGRFRDVTGEAKIPAWPYLSVTAAFVDIDHDGDLDIFVGGLADTSAGFAEAPSLVLQNNGNGTFTDITANTQLGGRGHTVAVIPTDFDNRRDIDLFVLRAEGPALFKNMRDGTFRDMAAELGLQAKGPFWSAAAADVNKDGFTDFFLGGATGSYLALSDGKGAFQVAAAPPAAAGALAAQFLDYDDDGLLDLLVVTAKGPHLLRNLGSSWADVTAAAFGSLRETAYDGAALATADLDQDGDTDVLVATPRRLLSFTNEGGNRNHSFAVQLTGRVSNKQAVGVKVDIRAGSLRQRLETSDAVPMAAPADLLFGLGSRPLPDAVRMIWVSGIVQTEIEMGQPAAGKRASLAVTELDRKPSSCPYLYAWNGTRFEFVTDFLGKGEMGYYEAPGVRNVPDPVENVRLAPGQLVAKDSRYELRVTNELEEVLYLDQFRLLAIDHPSDVEVYPNEGMANPPKPFRLYAVRDPRVPRATDDAGRDVTARLAKRDRVFVDGFPLERIRGYAKPHALVFDLSALPKDHTLLLLTGWTDYAFSSDNVAAHQAGLPSLPPRIELEQADGSWKTAIEDVGIPVGRPQTIVVDLTGRLGRSRRARLVTSLRVYWDEAKVAAPAADVQLRPVTLAPQRATLAERGFSAETSPDGREPWSYDYARVSLLSPWKTMPGRYTRTGDVRALLASVDDSFVVSRPGDELALSFDARALPALRPGFSRTFLVHGDGFSKEMDINSASPDVVTPLPYHGMRSYPYAEAEVPAAVRRRFEQAAVWNTRLVVRPTTPIELYARQPAP